MKAPSWPLPSPVLHGRLPGKPSTPLVKRDGGERFMAPRAYHCGCPTTSIARPATWVCRCLSGARLSGSMLQWRGDGEMVSDVKASMDIFGHFGGGRTDKASRTEGTEGCPQGMGLLMTRTWGVARTLWRPKRRLRADPSWLIDRVFQSRDLGMGAAQGGGRGGARGERDGESQLLLEGITARTLYRTAYVQWAWGTAGWAWQQRGLSNATSIPSVAVIISRGRKGRALLWYGELGGHCIRD